MVNFWKIVNKVIEESDIILEVLDARLIEETRNSEVEARVKENEKQLIFVVNKCDLVGDYKLKKEIARLKIKPVVFVSSTEKLGTTILRNKILRFAKTQEVVVGVLGYPNTGKSSLINALKGKASAKASSMSGFTKAMQLIRMDKRIQLLDTPGVIPYKEKNDMKHIKISTVDFTKVKDAEAAAEKLIEDLDGVIEDFYGVNKFDDPEDTLKKIAVLKNLLKKKAEPDLDRVARLILKDWQTGKIKQI